MSLLAVSRVRKEGRALGLNGPCAPECHLGKSPVEIAQIGEEILGMASS